MMKTNEENDLNEKELESEVKFNPPLYIQRYQFVFDLLNKNSHLVTKIADFGAAEGKIMRRFKRLSNVEEIALIDCDEYSLEICSLEARPLVYDYLFSERLIEMTVNVYNGSVAQRDSRLLGYDVITCIELIEHLKDEVLVALPDNIFGFICPKFVIITTPNSEYNVMFSQLKCGQFRHWDHKFEWNRQQFTNWCQTIVNRYPNYTYELTGVGEPPICRKDIGFCTQIAIFTRFQSNECPNEINVCEDYNNNYKLIETFKYPMNKNNKTESQTYVDWPTV
ncbi:small RNA 2'-O-methyltransferase-like [Oppia nitens]|uniref:small RNA 2'-O-methyltransferase-like n=1 Tax=Oppia nitens TaxID=1686743 RepID=UPI0023DB5B1C|nr:small RNA 2'-O-methyltransferase-like [Oppia nitens]